MRDIYEVPAAAIVLTAHQELEQLVGTIHQNQFKPALDQKWGYLVYAGLWWEPLRSDLDAYMDAVNAQVTRDDRAEALQGLGARRHARVAERRLRRLARLVRRVRRALLADRLARLHRAVVAAVAARAPAAQPRVSDRLRRALASRVDEVGRCHGNAYKALGFVVWKGGAVVPAAPLRVVAKRVGTGLLLAALAAAIAGRRRRRRSGARRRAG